MSQTAIFGPFFAVMLLTLAVWTYMYVRRIHFLQSNDIQPDQIATPDALARMSPPGVATPSDNLKNLFELPVLFYGICLYLFATSQVDGTYIGAGWVFASFRALHSAVHCTFNHIMTRFTVYLIASLALWTMVVRAALAHFGS
ncbi:MAG TPA: MAPEG family protein [Myxococcota bacterium]|jgi:hypothetical protein|nr:MAPEG family protein [Myxococcota bacterium]